MKIFKYVLVFWESSGGMLISSWLPLHYVIKYKTLKKCLMVEGQHCYLLPSIQKGGSMEKFVNCQGPWPGFYFQCSPFILTPELNSSCQESDGNHPWPSASFTGFWCRTSWHHSSKEATVATSPVIVQLKFRTLSPVLPQSLLIRQLVTQQSSLGSTKTKHLVLLHHAPNVWLPMSSLQLNQNDFFLSLTNYIPENTQCKILLCNFGKI